MTTNYTQLRHALGLTEEQAASLVNAAAFERGVHAGVDAVTKGLSCTSVPEAIATRDPLVLPNIDDALLSGGAPVEEGPADA
jgi:hypothetical protein